MSVMPLADVRRLPRPSDRALDQLLEINALIESSFLEVGVQLEQAFSLLGETRHAFARFAEACSDEFLLGVDTALAGLKQEIAALIDAADQQGAWLVDLMQLVGKAADPLHSLGWAVAMIHAVAMNARIVAAQMHPDTNEEVLVFADEVFTIAAEAMIVTKQLRADHWELHRDAQVLADRNASFAKAIRSEAGCVSARLEGGLKAFQSTRHIHRIGLSKMSDDSARASSELADIMFSQQAGDAARQRIEHVIAALDTAPDDIRPAVYGLQAAQLGDTHARLAANTRQVALSMGNLVATMREQFEQAQAHLHDNVAQFDIDDFIATIAASIRTLQSADLQRRDIEALARRIGDSVIVLEQRSAQVRKLEFGMRLVSFNTAIACARLGDEGNALSEISHQMRMLFAEMMAQSSQAIPLLLQIGELAGSSTALDPAENSRVSSLIDDTQTALENALTVGREMAASRTSIQRQSGVIATVSERIVASLDNQATIPVAIAAAVDLLPPCEASPGDAIGPGWDEVFARYTMQEERDVHAAFFGGSRLA